MTFHLRGRFTLDNVSAKTLRIGQVAQRAAVGAKAIRFYEANAVIPRPARGENGYRLYSPEIVDVLRFIKQAQGLGLTLGEIKEIVAIRQGGRPPSCCEGPVIGDRVEVLEGVKPGERVVTDGSFFLRAEATRARSGGWRRCPGA